MLDVRAEYTRRLETYQRVIAGRELAHLRLGNAKLFAIAAGLILLWLSLGRHRISLVWVVAMAGVYAALAIWHQRVIRARTRAETAVAFYRRGIDRVEDRWMGTGSFGERFRDEKHIYAADLDLFGRGSLFELLSLARLPMGEAKLAEWLRSPSALNEILERQSLVAELRENLDLREALAMTAEELRGAKLNPEGLITWSEETCQMPGNGIRALALIFVPAVFVALGWSFAKQTYVPIVSVLLAQGVYFYWLRDRARKVVALDSDGEALKLFSEILRRLEDEKFSSERLRNLAGGFGTVEHGASRAMRKLSRLMGWMEAAQARPLVVQVLDRLFAYTVHVGFAAESWRRREGAQVRSTVASVGEIEALLSLAGYSFEHPDDGFPELAESSGVVGDFDGVELGHPLIPAAQCVRNRVRLGDEIRLLLISGSNMSGKSTLLRTVGINVVLAMAGAPVRAKALRMTPLTLGTHMQSGDSLQEGRSNFYTEILRLRRVFDLAGGTPPLLFLFDELLEGTNSHDRRIGAETLLRAFAERGGIGIVTTHDLVLTELAATFDGRARNAHFEDSVEDGKMRFDYKLKEGVVARSNALELMRLIGLKV